MENNSKEPKLELVMKCVGEWGVCMCMCMCVLVCMCVCVWLVGNMETKQKLSNSGGLGDPKKKQPDRDGW